MTWLALCVVYLLVILLVARVSCFSGVLHAVSGKSSRTGRENTCNPCENGYSGRMANVPQGSDTPPVIRGYGMVVQPPALPRPPHPRVQVFKTDWSSVSINRGFSHWFIRLGKLRVVIRRAH